MNQENDSMKNSEPVVQNEEVHEHDGPYSPDDGTRRRSRRFYGVVTGVVIASLAILSAAGIYQMKRASDLSLQVENGYTRAFCDMADYVNDIDVLLKKAMLANSPAQMASLSSQMYMQTAAAKACLAQLPTGNTQLESTSKFLSQVGDYTAYLSAKVINDGTVTEEEFNNLMELSKYADNVNGSISSMQESLYNGQLSFIRTNDNKVHAAEGATDFSSGMEQLEKEFQDYPTLIYDGPFSEHIEQMEPEMLKGETDVSEEQAMKMARLFLGEERASTLALSGEGEGSIPTYSFASQSEDRDSRQISIDITKQGGHVLWMLDSREVGDAVLSVKEAIDAGKRFLDDMGFYNMEDHYYEKSGNVATINYAYTIGDVTMYSDLIKVKVALDNGEIIGFESRGYLMSHKDRSLPHELISQEEAAARANPHLNIEAIRKAVIPLESMREVLCYELRGSFNGQNFLIYVNAQTGQDEKILMLIESEEGILTM